jgi:protein-L-isoaspartate(D-aspartate) O-methyltransferase
MTPEDSETTSTDRARMVERQLRRRGITDERVLQAMASVPRERFLPEHQRRRAYRDGAVRIGEGQTMSQPWIVACMAQLLALEGHETVLEVGTGSGYAAAVLSLLCREVVTIERFESLAEEAAATLVDLGYTNVEVRTGDGTRGAPDRAPFGGISVTATARDEPPPHSCAPWSAAGTSCSCATWTARRRPWPPCASCRCSKAGRPRRRAARNKGR